eukprot:gene7957-biopygen15125
MDGHGAAGAACIPPQNKQRVTRCRRHCVTSRGEALCRLPWCEQVRRGLFGSSIPILSQLPQLQEAAARRQAGKAFSLSFPRTWRMRCVPPRSTPFGTGPGLRRLRTGSPSSAFPGPSSWSRKKQLRTRPGRVRFFKIYCVGRVRDASGTCPRPFLPEEETARTIRLSRAQSTSMWLAAFLPKSTNAVDFFDLADQASRLVMSTSRFNMTYKYIWDWLPDCGVWTRGDSSEVRTSSDLLTP